MPLAMGGSNNNYGDNSLVPSRILIARDATKDCKNHELRHTINNIRLRGGIVHPGDTIMVFGVLHKVLHPMGYQMGVAPENFLGATHIRAMEEEVTKKVDMYVRLLRHSAEECEVEGVNIEVKIMAGTPTRKVVVQEAAISNVAWVIIDRHLRRELRFFLKHIRCKVALVLDNFILEVLRPYNSNKETDYVEDKQYFSLSKAVPQQPVSDNENNEQSVVTVSYYASMVSMESSDMAKSSMLSSFASDSGVLSISSQYGFGSNPTEEESVMPKQRRKPGRNRFSDVPVLCIACGLKTELDSKRYSYSKIQLATDEFSSDNLLGEGGYGLVYKGQLKDGQLIAAKVRKQASTQGFEEFHSEVYVLSFARHKNIVKLLGYCCKENLNILVYEYICNKSLEWHLFDNTNHVLEWHRRLAIAIGTAKGLRFLHEESRGSPIIHRDMRPSNILLTHDFVPMLGNFGLAKWKTDEDEIQTRILGTLGYLAPEYAENGIVLIQLISGRRAVDSTKKANNCLLDSGHFGLPELVDPHIGESYNTYEMYNMARTAYQCVQTDPELRPSMAEVLRFLEGESDHFHHLTEQFMPHYSK